MRKLLVRLATISLCLLLISPHHSIGQNLVPNPGFETFSSAPTTYGQISNATGWSSAYGSCDLFHPSASAASVGIPTNYFGTQTAHGGICYAGLAWSSTNSYHELLRVQLTSPLTIGNPYYAEAYVSAGEGSYRYGVNNFGFLLTTTAVAGGATDPPIIATPQVNWTTPITDYTNWTLVSGTFTATSAAQYLTLGSFFSTAATTWVLLGTAGSINSQYWFVDDIVVQPSVVLEDDNTIVTAEVFGSKSAMVKWENTSGDRFRESAVERSTDGGNTWTRAGNTYDSKTQAAQGSVLDMPGVFGEPLLYRIRLVSEDGTVTHSHSASVTLPYPLLRETLVFSPSPVRQADQGMLQFYLSKPSLCEVSLHDMTGTRIWTSSQPFTAGMQNVSPPLTGLAPGIYFIGVTNGGETAFTKFSVILN